MTAWPRRLSGQVSDIHPGLWLVWNAGEWRLSHWLTLGWRSLQIRIQVDRWGNVGNLPMVSLPCGQISGLVLLFPTEIYQDYNQIHSIWIKKWFACILFCVFRFVEVPGDKLKPLPSLTFSLQTRVLWWTLVIPALPLLHLLYTIFSWNLFSLSLCINTYMLWKRTQFHTIPSNLLTSLEEGNKHSYATAIFEGSIVWSTIPPVCPTCRRHTYNFSELSTAFTWVKDFLAPNTIMQFLSC